MNLKVLRSRHDFFDEYHRTQERVRIYNEEYHFSSVEEIEVLTDLAVCNVSPLSLKPCEDVIEHKPFTPSHNKFRRDLKKRMKNRRC